MIKLHVDGYIPYVNEFDELEHHSACPALPKAVIETDAAGAPSSSSGLQGGQGECEPSSGRPGPGANPPPPPPGPEETGDDDIVCQPCAAPDPCVRDLRAEAESEAHQMTHLPKNPWCPACQVSKRKTKHARRTTDATAHKAPTKFGQEIVADTLISKNPQSTGYDGPNRL